MVSTDVQRYFKRSVSPDCIGIATLESVIVIWVSAKKRNRSTLNETSCDTEQRYPSPLWARLLYFTVNPYVKNSTRYRPNQGPQGVCPQIQQIRTP